MFSCASPTISYALDLLTVSRNIQRSFSSVSVSIWKCCNTFDLCSHFFSRINSSGSQALILWEETVDSCVAFKVTKSLVLNGETVDGVRTPCDIVNSDSKAQTFETMNLKLRFAPGLLAEPVERLF